MMKYRILGFLTAIWLSSGAQGPYNLAAIPDSLKQKAHVIVHQEKIDLEIESLDKAVMKVKKIYTVVSEEGRQALMFHEYVTKFISLDDVEIKVYDKNGRQTSRHKKKDLTTVAEGEGLIEDGYVSFLLITPPSYPVTVEVNYTQVLKGSLFLPAYRFIHSKMAVLESSYTARVPTDISIRYKAKNCSLQPVITDEGRYRVHQWSVKNLPPIENEPGTVSELDKYPHVNIVTEQFSHYGFRGELSSWKSFGNWLNELYKGLDELPAERQQFFRQLVKDAGDDTEKIRRIYGFLQKNFRYVSIQLGIGGLKPFPARFTDEKKYGDCKGLSNYMKAALQAVGIKSYVAIINAGYNAEPVDPAFPANQFNHMILCVPRERDSIWLECTSQTAEFGKLGTFTENRNALLITEQGGVLVPTPKSQAAANLFITRNQVQIEEDLSAISETLMTAAGEFREMLGAVAKEKKDDQKKFFVMALGFKQPDDFIFNQDTVSQHAVLKMAIRKLPEFNAGSKYFFSPRIHKLWPSRLPPATGRTMDYYFRFPFEMRDTTVLKLSAFFTPDVLPREKLLRNAYAYYQTKSWHDTSENAVFTATTLVLTSHRIPAADYILVKEFFDEVLQDDTQRIVLKKNENAVQEKKAF